MQSRDGLGLLLISDDIFFKLENDSRFYYHPGFLVLHFSLSSSITPPKNKDDHSANGGGKRAAKINDITPWKHHIRAITFDYFGLVDFNLSPTVFYVSLWSFRLLLWVNIDDPVCVHTVNHIFILIRSLSFVLEMDSPVRTKWLRAAASLHK